MCKSICGFDCGECEMNNKCKGCAETNGRPFGGACIAAECINNGGAEAFWELKKQLISELNALGVHKMPNISELNLLCGSYVNLEYTLPSGEKTKLLDDNKIYLGAQVECVDSGGDRCYGMVADTDFLLVCEYGENGADPEIVIYKRR